MHHAAFPEDRYPIHINDIGKYTDMKQDEEVMLLVDIPANNTTVGGVVSFWWCLTFNPLQ